MITPQFDVKQDNTFIYVDVRAPYIKASLVHFEVADDTFVLTLPPYYLRLRFPGMLIEDDRMGSSYDLKTSTIHCKIAKLHSGEYFEDLDMLSKLLATKNQHGGPAPARKPLIQETDFDPEAIRMRAQDPDFDWEVEQAVSQEVSSDVKYGFNNQYSEIIGMSLHTGNEINELAEPESESSASRLGLMRESTRDSFDAEHYLADKYDDEMISELISGFRFPESIPISASGKDRVARLGSREFFLQDRKSTYIGIIPILFGWAYEFRANSGEMTVESSWTIGKLAPSMCYLFNNYQTVISVVQDCTARSLSRPLYRNWTFTLQIWKDTLQLLRQGRQALLAVFAMLLETFEHDLHFVYRQILIEDYAIWIQYASEKVVQSLANELEKAISTLEKSNIDLPLEETERGELTAQEGEGPINANAPDSDDESE